MLRLPAGMRDYAPEAAAARRRIVEALCAVFERRGFARVITPAFEYEDVLALGLGDAARAATVRFVEPSSGQVVALGQGLARRGAIPVQQVPFADMELRLAALRRGFCRCERLRRLAAIEVELGDGKRPLGRFQSARIGAHAAHRVALAGVRPREVEPQRRLEGGRLLADHRDQVAGGGAVVGQAEMRVAAQLAQDAGVRMIVR